MADLEIRMEALEAGLADNTLAIRDVTRRLNKIDMNGHGPKLKRFLDETAPRIELLADYVDELVVEGRRARDGAAFWRVVRRFTGWNIGAKVVFQLTLGGILAALAFFLVQAVIVTTPNPSSPPSPTSAVSPGATN